jgi:hypothetical protein
MLPTIFSPVIIVTTSVPAADATAVVVRNRKTHKAATLLTLDTMARLLRKEKKA